jgi:predicted RecA/RadA family phage recombinase
MKNEYMRPGGELSLPVDAGTKSGDPVKVGGFCGVAATDRGAGGNIATHASVLIDGRVYTINVDGAITGVGQAIYIVPATRVLQTSATGAELWGYSAVAADGSFATKSTGVGPALVKPLTV